MILLEFLKAQNLGKNTEEFSLQKILEFNWAERKDSRNYITVNTALADCIDQEDFVEWKKLLPNLGINFSENTSMYYSPLLQIGDIVVYIQVINPYTYVPDCSFRAIESVNKNPQLKYHIRSNINKKIKTPVLDFWDI
jgi:hypothetical protein